MKNEGTERKGAEWAGMRSIELRTGYIASRNGLSDDRFRFELVRVQRRESQMNRSSLAVTGEVWKAERLGDSTLGGLD